MQTKYNTQNNLSQDLVDFLYELEKEWKKQSQKLSDKELFDIFPEAKDIILDVIAEYKESRKVQIRKMIEFYKKIIRKGVDRSSEYFWYQYLKTFHAPKVDEIDKHLKRLYLQRNLINPNHNGKNFKASLEELKQQAKNVPIFSIAEPYLRKVRFHQTNITALCPFHAEKTPSFVISLSKNIFRCFGCGAYGDSINFVMKIEKLTFKEAVRRLTL